jgi:hypothetical protein
MFVLYETPAGYAIFKVIYEKFENFQSTLLTLKIFISKLILFRLFSMILDSRSFWMRKRLRKLIISIWNSILQSLLPKCKWEIARKAVYSTKFHSLASKVASGF